MIKNIKQKRRHLLPGENGYIYIYIYNICMYVCMYVSLYPIAFSPQRFLLPKQKNFVLIA